MTPSSPSPPLIKGIDGIVSRSPNEVNYSTLNGKKTKATTRIEQELRMKYGKYKIVYNSVKIENKANNTSKTKILNRPSNKNKNKQRKNKVDYDGEEDGVTRVAQSKKYENMKLNTDTTNDSIYTTAQVPAISTMEKRPIRKSNQ